MQNLGTIDNIYTILSIKSQEQLSDTYSVRNNETQLNYLIEVFKDNIPPNEINILNILNALNNPYIIYYVGNGNGPIILNNEPPKNKSYIIYEDVSHSDLSSYIINYESGFSEKQEALRPGDPVVSLRL